MDAIKFLTEKERMCDSFVDCFQCPAQFLCDDPNAATTLVEVVEKWSKEHPFRTRKDVFLEQWPNAILDEQDLPRFQPCQLDHTMICKRMVCTKERNVISCSECSRDFWMKRVE